MLNNNTAGSQSNNNNNTHNQPSSPPLVTVQAKIGLAALPRPGTKGAPRTFYGLGDDIEEWLGEYENATAIYQVEGSDLSTGLLQYACAEVRELIRVQPKFSRWYALKVDLKQLFPSVLGALKYSRTELDTFVRESSLRPMTTRMELEKYNQAYQRRAFWLIEKNKITQEMVDESYWQGLPENVRIKCESDLRAKQGTSFSRKNPFKMDDIMECARDIFDFAAFDAPFRHGGNENEITMEKRHRIEALKRRNVSQGHPDQDRGQQQEIDTLRHEVSAAKSPEDREMEELVTQLSGLQVTDANYAICWSKLATISSNLAACYEAPKLRTQNPIQQPSPSGPNPFNRREHDQNMGGRPGPVKRSQPPLPYPPPPATRIVSFGPTTHQSGASTSLMLTVGQQTPLPPQQDAYQQRQAPAPHQFALDAPSHPPAGGGNQTCEYCGKTGHSGPNCISAFPAIRQGVIVNRFGRLAWPDGRPIPLTQGLQRFAVEAKMAAAARSNLATAQQERLASEYEREEEPVPAALRVHSSS